MDGAFNKLHISCKDRDIIAVGSDASVQILVVDERHVELLINESGRESLVRLENEVNSAITPRSAAMKTTATDETRRDKERWTLEFLLLGDLIELLEEEYDEENRRWMLVVLDGLLDAIPAEGRHQRLETLRQRFPNAVHLPNALTRLELEHDELMYQLRKLRNRVAWRFSVLDAVGEEVCDELRSWVVTFTQFVKREADLCRQAHRTNGDRIPLHGHEMSIE